MNRRGKKLEPKLGLDMSFGELLGRLVQTDPKEIERNIDKSKKKKPPGSRKPSGGKGEAKKNVVELRQRRMRKRNYGR